MQTTRTWVYFGARKVFPTVRVTQRGRSGEYSAVGTVKLTLQVSTYYNILCVHGYILHIDVRPSWTGNSQRNCIRESSASPSPCYVLNKRYLDERTDPGWMPPGLLCNSSSCHITANVPSDTAAPVISEKLHVNQFSLETQSTSASSQAIWNLEMNYLIITCNSQ